MSVLFDVADIANQYGASKFYEQVRATTLRVLEASNLEVDEYGIRDFYQRFAFAYVVGVKTRSPQEMIDLLTDDTFEPIGGWTTVIDDSGLLLANSDPLLAQKYMNCLVQTDSFATEELATCTFLNAHGSPEQHQLAFSAAHTTLTQELSGPTGFAGLIESLYPGRYQTYIGDSFNDMVLICE